MSVRDAIPADLDALAHLWWSGWHETNIGVVPDEALDERTLASFHAHLSEELPHIRVAGAQPTPTGFHIVEGDVLSQIYVAPEARGQGAASQLLGDAETRMARSGVTTAWLACTTANHRAARFYEKHGWKKTKTFDVMVETSTGGHAVKVWRFEKQVGP